MVETAPSTALTGRSTSLTGIGIGLLFWFVSLMPTLIPRGWIVQGVTSGACLAIGYGIGLLAARWVGRLRSRWLPDTKTSRQPAIVRLVARIACVTVVVIGIAAWTTWQNDARDLVGMPHLAWWEGPPMVLLSLGCAIGFIWIGARIGAGLRAIDRFMHRRLPHRTAVGATIVVVVVGAFVIGGEVVFRGVGVAANVIYEALDQGTNPGIDPPTRGTVSGSPESLVAWETMGRWGRDFAAGVTSRDQLLAYHGADAEVRDPIRVFVGMRTVDSVEERARLAVRELERAGAFERSVLVVWIPAGSGWMDPNAARALEQLHSGDTAIAAIQYSYLPSFFSWALDSSRAIEAGTVLFDAVHDRWADLPETDRPQLIVFGASLGAGGAEAPFVGADAASSVANFAARADGALLVGSLRQNTILRQVTAAREPGTPFWQPVYDAGTSVRFMFGELGRPALDAGWASPRILFLQHPSDPVSYWGFGDIWSAPEWMVDPRGTGVPAIGGWFPIVSTIQAMADIAFQSSLPPGYGHDYRREYADAFARVAPPASWTDADTARLEAYLAEDAATASGAP
ncbi:MAG TPA: alpha/beta-hydrolase family protein [Candidatus Limnocylindria bacterium]